MRNEINITVRNKIATVDKTLYVCGNTDYEVVFDFDEEWSEHPAKTVRFISKDEYIDVVMNGNRCNMPMFSNTTCIRVGVFAGNLCTTTSAFVMAQKSILCENGSPAAPTDDVYNQLMSLLENLVYRVETLEQGGVVDAATAKLGEAILGRLKLR